MNATDLGKSARACQQARNSLPLSCLAVALGKLACGDSLHKQSGARWPQWRQLISVNLLLLLLCMGAAPAVAAPATYSGEAPVASQSEAERAEALKTALAAVVIRLSGDPGILANGKVAAAVAEAEKYVLQYRYQRGLAAEDSAEVESASMILVAEFDSNAVDRMLAALGLGSANAAAAMDSTPTEQRIWLSGIHSAEDYARGLGYLSKQSLVRQSRPLEARDDGLLVHLSLSSGLQRWLEVVDGEGVLRVNSASPPLEGIDATLVLNP